MKRIYWIEKGNLTGIDRVFYKGQETRDKDIKIQDTRDNLFIP
ncbi:MAG TPA: hypothetical protein PLW02_09625 [Verrucomicrobiota bacterium]|nr:hypothetical protein [Verrucomicrobiota bacterium]